MFIWYMEFGYSLEESRKLAVRGMTRWAVERLATGKKLDNSDREMSHRTSLAPFISPYRAQGSATPTPIYCKAQRHRSLPSPSTRMDMPESCGRVHKCRRRVVGARKLLARCEAAEQSRCEDIERSSKGLDKGQPFDTSKSLACAKRCTLRLFSVGQRGRTLAFGKEMMKRGPSRVGPWNISTACGVRSQVSLEWKKIGQRTAVACIASQNINRERKGDVIGKRKPR